MRAGMIWRRFSFYISNIGAMVVTVRREQDCRRALLSLVRHGIVMHPICSFKSVGREMAEGLS